MRLMSGGSADTSCFTASGIQPKMGAAEITQFLTALAVRRKVAAATQNQALSALLFLYREVLGQEIPWLEDVVRAKHSHRLPVVLTRDEVRAVGRSGWRYE